jgi:hypothetical protein
MQSAFWISGLEIEGLIEGWQIEDGGTIGDCLQSSIKQKSSINNPAINPSISNPEI